MRREGRTLTVEDGEPEGLRSEARFIGGLEARIRNVSWRRIEIRRQAYSTRKIVAVFESGCPFGGSV